AEHPSLSQAGGALQLLHTRTIHSLRVSVRLIQGRTGGGPTVRLGECGGSPAQHGQFRPALSRSAAPLGLAGDRSGSLRIKDNRWHRLLRTVYPTVSIPQRNPSLSNE